MKTSKKSLPASTQNWLALFEKMVLLRRFEERVQQQYKAGRMPGFVHLYIGQEAVAVGVCAHLKQSDWITSTHRGHGHALAKGVSPAEVMAELYGKQSGCNGGRGGSMHLYDADVGLLGTNGFVGGGLPSTVGAALSARARKTDGVAVAFFGDGAVNHGTFHESVNLATALGAPVVFVCENNLYATATPLREATKNIDIASRGAAYGLPGIAVDGNDVLAVEAAAREAIERARKGDGPTLLEARTYRTVGHHEGDPVVGTYRNQEELDIWKARDPIVSLRANILKNGVADEAVLQKIETRIAAEIEEAIVAAEADSFPDSQTALQHVWAAPRDEGSTPSAGETREQGWLDAVRDGIAEEMRANPNILYLGEGIGERGGSFAHTKNLWAEFGANRVVDTPISELGFTGAGVGAAATGCPAIADLMFTDFVFEAASQIIQQAGKLRYLTRGKVGVPLIIRSGMGAIKNAGAHHSGTYYPMWSHCPGLLVAVPSNPADAKALWKTALRGGDPVLMFEHKMLFGSKGLVPQNDVALPFGRASIAREGRDITLVACGLMVHRCLDAAKKLAGEIDCEVIDLRTIVPLDVETIVQSVAKTGRVLVVDEAFAFCGLGAEIAATIMEHAFDELDAPLARLHTEPVAQPFSPSLEDAVVVSMEKIIEAARGVMKGRAPIQNRAPSLGANKNAPEIQPRKFQDAPVAVVEKMELQMSDLREAEAASIVDDGENGVPIIPPNQDLTITEGTVAAWLKSVGDAVSKGETIAEVETAKAVVAVESPAKGVLRSIVAAEGSVVSMKGILGFIDAGKSA